MASSFAILSGVITVFLTVALIEFQRHQRRVFAIPHRIHVNGTRGKSSVTRLIGAGLRAGGLRTVTKVTGTFPRLILGDGNDVPVHRKAAPTILEQLAIVDFALARDTEALVIECMALDPRFQRITEEQMVHATLAVFTNVRLDHTDVMGRTIEEIGVSMANTIPRNGRLLTAERDHVDMLGRLSKAKGTEMVAIRPDDITTDDMAGFSYIEHRDNVALALAVCAELGVKREVALRGMWRAIPDPGVLTRSMVEHQGRVATLFNAFAANDPESSLMVWRKLRDEGHLVGQRFVLLNTRPDRKDRAEQLAHLVATSLASEVDAVFLMGSPTDAVQRSLRAHGMNVERIIDLGRAEPTAIFHAILAATRERSSVVAIGNMGGQGASTVAYFDTRKQRHG